MSRCLREQTLLWVYEGEGTSRERAHVETCAACATRYQRLVHDLEVIGQVLREAPSSGAVPHRRSSLRLRWMPVAAALAVALLVVWGGVRMQSPAPPEVPGDARNDDAVLFLEEVSTLLFATDDAGAAAIPTPVSPAVYLQAALQGEWPCEGQEPGFNPECEDDSFPLLFGGL